MSIGWTTTITATAVTVLIYIEVIYKFHTLSPKTWLHPSYRCVVQIMLHITSALMHFLIIYVSHTASEP